MDNIIELLKAFFIGIVEGITEWLPISSTGHMILVDEFVKLNVSAEFLELFLVVIQLGAICAVLVLYFHKLNPLSPKKDSEEKRSTWRLWGMVLIGCIPAAIIGLLFDDWVNEHFYNAWTVAIALIFYGVVFIVMEHINRKKESERLALSHARHGRIGSRPAEGRLRALETNIGESRNLAREGKDGDDAEMSMFRVQTVDEIDWKTALGIGCFQVLAIIPGTSRSGSTIIGGMILGCSRTAAAEFTFFCAIPVMLGWGIVKFIKYLASMGAAMAGIELWILLVGIATAFVVSILSIRFLMSYIKRNDFTAFGIYRIVLGVCVLAYFAITGAKVVG